MDAVVLDDIPFRIEFEGLLKRVRMNPDRGAVDELGRMVGEAEALGKPKTLYRAAFIESRGDDYVLVDGVALNSRVLRVNLDQAHRIFPFVATCGRELDEWAQSKGDLLQRYWAEMIKEMALRLAIKTLIQHMEENFRPGKTSRMNPGSLEDWPLEEQRGLFALLGNTEDTVGVQLTDSLLMIPTRSVSGILFPTEVSFESCQLCPREDCPGRRAPYDSGLYDRKYRD